MAIILKIYALHELQKSVVTIVEEIWVTPFNGDGEIVLVS